ncbi:MAG: 6-carboxytetrahydropterin synthase [Planctomycetota bacterium]|nr:6-carboxytetrahydropterin synthase [Planctomycetota bacterium]
MFKVSVKASFLATHAITIDGVEEDPHEHDWKVVASVRGDELDNDDLLVDFLELQQSLEDAIAPLRNTNLNRCPELRGNNPTAESVAWYVGDRLQNSIQSPATLFSVQVTEAPNCIATYQP